MTASETVHLLDVTMWPLVALIAIFVVRPHLTALMSKSRIRLSIFGQTIETTLPELQAVIEEQAEGNLTTEQLRYLNELQQLGRRSYANGVPVDDQRFLRVLRNAGLITTTPRDSYLANASAITLSALGRAFIRAGMRSGG